MQNVDTPFLNDEYDIANRAIFNALNSKSSCSVGTVVKINASPVSVDIQNGVKYFDKIQGFQTPPVLSNIPVMQLSNAAYSIKTPLNIGDVGLILWFDREVYTFLLNAGVTPVEPDSGNLNNEAACVFLPIMQKFSQANTLKPLGVEIQSGEVKLIEELINLTTALNTFSTLLITAGAGFVGHPTDPVLGAYPNAVSAAATGILSSVVTLTAKLTAFKGLQT
jgi:hypothetical protein